MKRFFVFGICASNLEAARTLVEEQFGRPMSLHDSLYRGGDYYRAGADDEANGLILQRNYVDFEGEWMFETHREFPYLLFVNDAIGLASEWRELPVGVVRISGHSMD